MVTFNIRCPVRRHVDIDVRPMEANAPDAGRTEDGQGGSRRYAALHVEESAVVIYDRVNNRAWVQSDAAVSLDDVA
jgi:hypothetical protein